MLDRVSSSKKSALVNTLVCCNNETLSHRASGRGDAAVARWLLETCDANPNVKTYSCGNKTPLHLACELRRVNVVRVLLEFGADPNGRTTTGGHSPLSLACCRRRNNHHKDNGVIISLLLENGANSEFALWDGDTPLHTAALYGCEEATRLLLQKGKANINATNQYGETPLARASRKGHARIGFGCFGGCRRCTFRIINYFVQFFGC